MAAGSTRVSDVLTAAIEQYILTTRRLNYVRSGYMRLLTWCLKADQRELHSGRDLPFKSKCTSSA